jgi:hypothetical protein
MQERHTSNEEAMQILRALGFKQNDRFNSRNEQVWTDPAGMVKKFKFQKRAGQRGKDGRHLVGIAYKFLDTVDAFVFWAKSRAVHDHVSSNQSEDSTRMSPNGKLRVSNGM